MSVVKGLGQMKNLLEKRESRGGPRFLKLKDGDSLQIRFLQELDEESEHYDKDAGLGVLVREWRDPENFRKRIVDTSETEGKCWPAEQRSKDYEENGESDWRPRVSLYVNVLVEREDEDDEVFILNQGLGPKSVVPWLIDYATETGSITNARFKIKRTGSGQYDTQYTLTPIGLVDPVDTSDLQLAEWDKVLNHVPYDQQEEYFRGDESDDDDGDNVPW